MTDTLKISKAVLGFGYAKALCKVGAARAFNRQKATNWWFCAVFCDVQT